MADNKEPKIFKLNRIKFNELFNDALAYIKSTYKAVGQTFNTASPFGQLLQVLLHLGRMIFYYIEDSISGLNIRTAYRPDQIKGLAMLAGHDAARPIAARGAIKISYFDIGDPRLTGNVCYIPNKTQIVNKINGFVYTILLGADNAKITMQSGNYIEANVIQGVIKMQAATGTGLPLQSFNFAERNYATVDQYYLNVYVNGEPWEVVSSLFDLGYQQKGVLVRTGIKSGIDIFFGNGLMGAIPPQGSSIVVEYCVCDGNVGNLTKEYLNSDMYWDIEGDGILASDGSSIPLNKIFKINCLSDIIFGTNSEDSTLTQILAPHVSRSFVLANEVNYKYFFKRMNMFSSVEIIRGSYSVNGQSVMQLAKDQAQLNYDKALKDYDEIVKRYGTSSNEAKSSYDNLQKVGSILKYTETKLYDNTYQDNTIYIFLVPDITKRISSAQNYFTCDESLFSLSKDEQENILNLINSSGQRIITVENRIIQPKIARFAINVEAKIWDNYEKEDVYSSALDALSKYFLNMTRKDMIPLSDIISLFENEVPGIDSVKVSFDADVNNKDIYGNDFYGIDNYGDIILTRKITDANGQYMEVKDILPLIRGGFVNKDGIEYSNIQSMDNLSAFNLTIATEKSSNDKINLSKYTALT